MSRKEDKQEQERLERRRRLQLQQEERRKQEEKKIIIAIVVLAVVLILVVSLLFRSCGKSKDSEGESASAQVNTESVNQNDSGESEDAQNESDSADAGGEESSPAGEAESDSPQTVPVVPAETSAAPETSAESGQVGANTTWNLAELSNESYSFGYSANNRDERNIPTDWQYYENMWGQFNVDWIQDTNSNTIYLTMDEGFPNTTTDGILDTLEEKGVKATFFLTNMYLEGETSRAQIERMIQMGCVLGNHSSTHPKMPSLSIEEQTNEITTVQNRLMQDYQYDAKLFRFPEGVYSAQSLGLVDNLGLKTVFWTYAYNDYSDTQPEVEPSLQAAIAGLHPGAVFLLHANSTTNAAFLGEWIDAARAAGYEFGVYPITAN